MAGFHIECHVLWWINKYEEDDVDVKEYDKRVWKITSQGWDREGGLTHSTYRLTTGKVRKTPEQIRNAKWCTVSSFLR